MTSTHLPKRRATVLSDLSMLLRPRLSCMTGFAALSGYLAAPVPANGSVAASVFAAVFLLTASASAYNQIQERARDHLIPRTSGRPLVTGRMRVATVLAVATACALSGLLLLIPLSPEAAMVGVFALAWYNLLYTPLKTKTSLVLLLGALGGALPPLLGWIASGASPFTPRAVYLYLLLILWQVPHFCCLALRDDLACQRSGLTIIPVNWTKGQIIRQIRLWSLSVGVLLLGALPLALLQSPLARGLICLLALWSVGWALQLRGNETPMHCGSATGMRLNLLLATSLCLIAIDPFLAS